MTFNDWRIQILVGVVPPGEDTFSRHEHSLAINFTDKLTDSVKERVLKAVSDRIDFIIDLEGIPHD